MRHLLVLEPNLFPFLPPCSTLLEAAFSQWWLPASPGTSSPRGDCSCLVYRQTAETHLGIGSQVGRFAAMLSNCMRVLMAPHARLWTKQRTIPSVYNCISSYKWEWGDCKQRKITRSSLIHCSMLQGCCVKYHCRRKSKLLQNTGKYLEKQETWTWEGQSRGAAQQAVSEQLEKHSRFPEDTHLLPVLQFSDKKCHHPWCKPETKGSLQVVTIREKESSTSILSEPNSEQSVTLLRTRWNTLKETNSS